MTSNPSAVVGIACRAFIGGRTVEFETASDKFEALAAAWDEHNAGMSTTDYSHPCYLQIIGMGGSVVPPIMDRLLLSERRWLRALKSIAGERVETDDMRGDVPRIIAAWLDWGKARGHLNGRIGRR